MVAYSLPVVFPATWIETDKQNDCHKVGAEVWVVEQMNILSLESYICWK